MALGWIPLVGLFTACLGIIFPITTFFFAKKSQKLHEYGHNLPARIYLNRAKNLSKITEVLFYVGLVASLAILIVLLFYYDMIDVASSDDDDND